MLLLLFVSSSYFLNNDELVIISLLLIITLILLILLLLLLIIISPRERACAGRADAEGLAMICYAILYYNIMYHYCYYKLLYYPILSYPILAESGKGDVAKGYLRDAEGSRLKIAPTRSSVLRYPFAIYPFPFSQGLLEVLVKKNIALVNGFVNVPTETEYGYRCPI